MNKGNLYQEEQQLLNKLVKAETSNDEEYKNALKRTIGRVNDEMKQVEEE